MTPLTTVVRIDAAFRRYTRDGPGPFFTGTDDQLVRTAACGLHRRTRDEAMPAEHYRVQVPTSGFLSGVIDVTDRTVLQAEWVPSSAGDRVIRFFAVEAAKPPAGTAELIVRRDRESEWSVVGMSVRRRRNPDPPTPLELLRRPTVDSGDLLASVLFWSRRASIPPAAPAPVPARRLDLFAPRPAAGTAAVAAPAPVQAPASYTDDTHPALTAALVKPPFGEPYLAAYADDLSFFPDEPAPPHPALVAAVLAGVRPAKPGVAYDATLLPQAVRYWARRPLPTPENEGGPAAFPVSAAPPAAATNPPTRPETTPS